MKIQNFVFHFQGIADQLSIQPLYIIVPIIFVENTTPRNYPWSLFKKPVLAGKVRNNDWWILHQSVIPMISKFGLNFLPIIKSHHKMSQIETNYGLSQELKILHEKWSKNPKWDTSGASYMISVHKHFRSDVGVMLRIPNVLVHAGKGCKRSNV
jgi:hypothetical protein